jgi:hypothetical protein
MGKGGEKGVALLRSLRVGQMHPFRVKLLDTYFKACVSVCRCNQAKYERLSLYRKRQRGRGPHTRM